MIRANELMIGDWVNTPDGISRVIYIAKYSGIYTDNTNIGEKLYSPYEINPIPLTPEILERNGWRKEFDKKLYMTFCHLEDEKYWLMWCISEHTLDVQRQNKTLLDQYNLCAERAVIVCDYIHQLQRALRCVGLFELANNFKI